MHDGLGPIGSDLPGYSPDRQALISPQRPCRLAALVVSHNRKTMLSRTVARLLDGPCDRVLVVDNGSRDGSRAWLMTQTDPRLRIILSPSNLGGAGGFELGLRDLVARDDPDWIVLMDDDARPAPGCFETFLAGGHGDWDAIATAVHLPDGTICEMNRPTINPFWNLPLLMRTALGALVGRGRGTFHVSDSAFQAPPRAIDAASFVGLFLSRAAVRTAGFPDGRMFIYGDDVMYTLGLRRAGLRLGFVPALRFEHDHDHGRNAKFGLYHPVWKAFYNARNGLRVYRQAAGPVMFWLVLPAVVLRWGLAGRHYGADRGRYWRLVARGMWDAVTGVRERPHAVVLALAGSADLMPSGPELGAATGNRASGSTLPDH